MSVLTQAIHTLLASDPVIQGLVSQYQGEPAIFTTEPAPGDAALPYIVTAGDVSQEPWGTKTTYGRIVTRDVRCYTAASGSAMTVEQIAERVRALLHRQELAVAGFDWVMAECGGGIAADEQSAYGRIVTVRMHLAEE